VRIVECEQGGTEWLEARMAIATASQFSRILTPTRKVSTGKGVRTYQHELIAEWLLGKPMGEIIGSGFVQRGSEMEAEAVRYYEFQREVETTRVGFVLLDPNPWDDGRFDEMVGCSPDRLVGDDGGLEIKCPRPAEHVANMLNMTSLYEMQCQGCMWITERKWWDILSFHPELPSAIVRLDRDEELIGQLAEAVGDFLQGLLHYREQLKEHKVEQPDFAVPEQPDELVECEAPRVPATGDGIPF